jgi:hypothetical protein
LRSTAPRRAASRDAFPGEFWALAVPENAAVTTLMAKTVIALLRFMEASRCVGPDYRVCSAPEAEFLLLFARWRQQDTALHRFAAS